jgi:hypothetical protein
MPIAHIFLALDGRVIWVTFERQQQVCSKFKEPEHNIKPHNIKEAKETDKNGKESYTRTSPAPVAGL